MITKLNLGCGHDYKEGWWNCDISNKVKAERHMDITVDNLPFDEGTIEEIYISGVLEQILENHSLIFVMNECWRVLKEGGQITIIVPNAKHAIAHRDPMDVRKFTAATFPYFVAGNQEYTLYGSVYGFKPWGSLNVKENQRHIFTVTMKKCVLRE